MTRLTNDMRSAITSAAVAHGFDARQEAFAAVEDSLAREAYAYVFTEAEIKAVGKVPENWFRVDSCLRFNVGGLTIQLSTIDAGLPVPFKTKHEEYGGYHCHILGVIMPGDLCDRIQSHAQNKDELKKARRAAHGSVQNMLYGVSTMKRLREVWPEGAAFYAAFETGAVPGLPAVRVDEINAALGLA